MGGAVVTGPGLDILRKGLTLVIDELDTSLHTLLSEFSPRKNEARERGYLLGRYGGVPFLGAPLEPQHVTVGQPFSNRFIKSVGKSCRWPATRYK